MWAFQDVKLGFRNVALGNRLNLQDVASDLSHSAIGADVHRTFQFPKQCPSEPF